MEIIEKIAQMKEFIKKVKKESKIVGLVPTMGYFHEGHLSLMRQARKDCDIVVVSIFVNPIQFGPAEDYERYPRDFNSDRGLAQSAGVDVIFSPRVEEMYPEGYCSYVEVERLTVGLCGPFRPGHFRGVTTVVAKLSNIVQSDKAYFGEKDYQQLLAIRKMVKDLNMDIEIVPMPTIREPDGLAMSSRNVYLSPEERQSALVLYQSLKEAEKMIASGERQAANVYRTIKTMIEARPKAKIDYIVLCNAQTLEKLERLAGEILIALAVRIGKTRLIDNIKLAIDT